MLNIERLIKEKSENYNLRRSETKSLYRSINEGKYSIKTSEQPK